MRFVNVGLTNDELLSLFLFLAYDGHATDCRRHKPLLCFLLFPYLFF